MKLIIDHGNSRTKAAVFDKDSCVLLEVFENDFDADTYIRIIDEYQCSNAVFSGVGSVKKGEIIKLGKKIDLLILDSNTPIPFVNNYATPSTLGVDRIALVAAANANFPKKNVLIIDAGTCITYDFINAAGVYEGGGISPGITMRFRALNTFTDKLPLLENNEHTDLIGKSTVECMQSGVVNGTISEIDNTINEYKKKNKDLTVVLTGGDVKFLANSLKNGIFANPNFLLEGLNAILTYNLA